MLKSTSPGFMKNWLALYFRTLIKINFPRSERYYGGSRWYATRAWKLDNKDMVFCLQECSPFVIISINNFENSPPNDQKQIYIMNIQLLICNYIRATGMFYDANVGYTYLGSYSQGRLNVIIKWRIMIHARQYLLASLTQDWPGTMVSVMCLASGPPGYQDRM